MSLNSSESYPPNHVYLQTTHGSLFLAYVDDNSDHLHYWTKFSYWEAEQFLLKPNVFILLVLEILFQNSSLTII